MTATLISSAQTKLANPFGLVYQDAISENASGKVNIHPVTYKLNGIDIAANVYTPVNYDPSKAYPAMVIAHPNGGVKEQVAGLYAQRLAESGYITIAADASYQGASGGKPRNVDKPGAEASPINTERDKYERGKQVLGELTLSTQNRPSSGYGAFAPVVDTFLKEHLFADIFERDVLTYAQRELVTISVLSAIGGAEPMLRSHLAICLNVGLTPKQLTEFVGIIEPTIGKEEAKAIKNILVEQTSEPVFPKGEIIINNNFKGTAWLQMLVNNDSTYNTSIGNVTFGPKARTNWHKHPGGQILLITDGQGYYQEKGKPAQLLHKGDVVKILPGAEHWHGAAPEYSLTHIAISPNTDKGSVIWLQPVSDEEYNGIKE